MCHVCISYNNVCYAGIRFASLATTSLAFTLHLTITVVSHCQILVLAAVCGKVEVCVRVLPCGSGIVVACGTMW